ncbi:hypothetical protein TNIN_188001 [Trichonephila inaurata madagascariensis]|uniref:Uncharacterized protein n=1 Tax=Trichonephila inaurata madagascariensis TaxID=2747483 RepID=A0A8X7CE10_9ARAC|nr:hypothetical protein TNIN_188001 [Trichonephila inaurata madagascariensis]
MESGTPRHLCRAEEQQASFANEGLLHSSLTLCVVLTVILISLIGTSITAYEYFNKSSKYKDYSHNRELNESYMKKKEMESKMPERSTHKVWPDLIYMDYHVLKPLVISSSQMIEFRKCCDEESKFFLGSSSHKFAALYQKCVAGQETCVGKSNMCSSAETKVLL